MANKYQWRMTTNYMSDTTLSHGVSPNTWQNWQVDTAGDRDGGTVSYWYRDSNTPIGGVYSDANSSRVVVEIRQRWNSRVDGQNNLIVTLNTTIQSVRRDDLRGTNQDTPGRTINIYPSSSSSSSSSSILTLTDTQLASAHTIYSGPLALPARTFTIAPGSRATGGQLRIHNSVIGGTSFDDIRVGVQFMNILPKNYRPGMIMKDGEWLSHNRNSGWAGIMTSGTYREMRTQEGGVASDDAPLIKHTDAYKNMRLIGKNG